MPTPRTPPHVTESTAWGPAPTADPHLQCRPYAQPVWTAAAANSLAFGFPEKGFLAAVCGTGRGWTSHHAHLQRLARLLGQLRDVLPSPSPQVPKPTATARERPASREGPAELKTPGSLTDGVGTAPHAPTAQELGWPAAPSSSPGGHSATAAAAGHSHPVAPGKLRQPRCLCPACPRHELGTLHRACGSCRGSTLGSSTFPAAANAAEGPHAGTVP